MADFFGDDFGVFPGVDTGWSTDPGFSFGDLNLGSGYQFDDWGMGSNYSSDWNLDSLSPAYYGSRLPGATNSDFDWLPRPVTDLLRSNVAPLAAAGLAYFNQRPMYKAAEEKMKRDQAWEEEQRKRIRKLQGISDQYSAPDPAATASINRIASNRGSYTGYGAPVGYGVVGSGVQRQPFFAAEGGSLPGDYKPGVLNWLRYMIAGRKFPWETDPQTNPAVFGGMAGQAERSIRDRRKQLDQLEENAVQGKASGGPLQRLRQGTYLRAPTKGQDDVIPVQAAGGEYVFDADAVSALGDGNNEAGAAALDKMRMNLRKHKRAAPADKIPPKAKRPEAYLKGGK